MWSDIALALTSLAAVLLPTALAGSALNELVKDDIRNGGCG